MAFILSLSLLSMSVVSLYYSYQISRQIGTKEKLTRTICILSAFCFLWCFGYGWMSVCTDYEIAYIARTVALAGVYGFVYFTIRFICVFTNTNNLVSKLMSGFTAVGGIILWYLVSRKTMVTFVNTFYGTYYVSNKNVVRIIQFIYVIPIFCYGFVVLVRWARKAKVYRERKNLQLLAVAAVMMPLGMVLDTAFPSFGMPAFPASSIGAFISMTMLYILVIHTNAIRLTNNNVSSYIFEKIGTPTLVLNYENEIELLNDSAKEFFELPEETFKQKKMSDIFEIAVEDAEHLLKEITTANSMRNCVLIERKTKAVCDVNINPVLDKHGDVVCNILFVSDMTKEYQMMSELEEMHNNLQMRLDEKTRQVEKVTLQAITTVANTIDAKDEYSKGHSVRVAEYAAELAKRIGWSEEAVNQIHYAALLYDIGKIGIPDSVLNKPSKLTDVEYELIKNHTLVGADILKDISSLENVDIAAKHHHERYDGTGYPSGLKGEDIPMTARIIGLADAFDAMSSDRVYRKRYTPEEVYEKIKAERGKQFDPVLTDEFLKMIEDGFCAKQNSEEETNSIIDESNKLLARVMEGSNEQKKIDLEKDYLTNLWARGSGEHKIMSFLQTGDGCLMIIDLDNFKSINDNFGHLTGDYALKIVAEVLLKHNHNAIISRIGGDEFLFFLKDVVDVSEVMPTVEGIIYTFNNKCQEEEILKQTSLSIGIAMSIEDGRDYAGLFNCADKALYYVKQNGKCGYSFFHRENQLAVPMNESKIDLQRLVAAIKHKETYQGVFKVEFREFSRIYDFVDHYTQRNKQKIQLVLFTLSTDEKQRPTMESMEAAMKYMEEAISSSLRGVDVSTRFSSTQHLVILVDTDRGNINVVTERILNKFYRMYDRRDMILNYDIANLEEE